MSTDILARQMPEEEELSTKKAELDALESELAQRELDLATLEAELRAFERRYLCIVGIRYAELDEIEAQIAEALAHRNPMDTKFRERASRSRAQAKESAQSVGTAKEAKQRDQFRPSEDLKKLYRKVAKLIHPDLVTDEKERARRMRLMAEANRAYETGDVNHLEAILREWESSPESVKGEGIGAELVRVIRKIAQVRERLYIIESKMTKLKQSELYHLQIKSEEAQKQGLDLLTDMATRLDEQISGARKRLAEVARRRTAK